MQNMYCIGLDVHKRTISYCVKDGSGTIHVQGAIPATRCDLDHWMKTLPQPWTATMEATVFTRWIYDHLQPHAAKNQKEFVPALLRSAPGETLALLTKTYHGSQIIGNWPTYPLLSGGRALRRRGRCVFPECGSSAAAFLRDLIG